MLEAWKICAKVTFWILLKGLLKAMLYSYLVGLADVEHSGGAGLPADELVLASFGILEVHRDEGYYFDAMLPLSDTSTEG
jgi:hypothetical protein